MNILIYIVLAIALGIAGYIGYGVFSVLVLDTKSYASYWEARRREAVSADAIRLVALGDSTMQAIGASSPLRGTVGRVAALLEKDTGRNVHIDNVSVSGAKAADVVRDQLGKIDVMSADLIIVAVGANDANRGTDLGRFRDSMHTLVTKLPVEKTIIADVAMIKGREPYQAIQEEVRAQKGMAKADIAASFQGVYPGANMTARDFFHPNDKGYEYWYRAFEPAVRQLIRERRVGR